MRILKKYPNRRLYDTQQSEYVTLDNVRKMILGKDPVKVLDSKTGKDLTRSVLLQIIGEQEAEGHEPLLTNRVLEQIVRFYGDSMQSVLSRYLEQSIMTFLEQQELYQRRMREVLNANPLKLMQRLADQNINFLRSLLPGEHRHRDARTPTRARKHRPRSWRPRLTNRIRPSRVTAESFRRGFATLAQRVGEEISSRRGRDHVAVHATPIDGGVCYCADRRLLGGATANARGHRSAGNCRRTRRIRAPKRYAARRFRSTAAASSMPTRNRATGSSTAAPIPNSVFRRSTRSLTRPLGGWGWPGPGTPGRRAESKRRRSSSMA